MYFSNLISNLPWLRHLSAILLEKSAMLQQDTPVCQNPY